MVKIKLFAKAAGHQDLVVCSWCGKIIPGKVPYKVKYYQWEGRFHFDCAIDAEVIPVPPTFDKNFIKLFLL